MPDVLAGLDEWAWPSLQHEDFPMFLSNRFLEHPASVGETYGKHMRTALSFAFPLARAAIAAVVHAFFPWLFTTSASRTVKQLNERMASRCGACARPCGSKQPVSATMPVAGTGP